jgi:hypothetical protein
VCKSFSSHEKNTVVAKAVMEAADSWEIESIIRQQKLKKIYKYIYIIYIST